MELAAGLGWPSRLLRRHYQTCVPLLTMKLEVLTTYLQRACPGTGAFMLLPHVRCCQSSEQLGEAISANAGIHNAQ